MYGIFIILSFYVIGNLLSWLIEGVVPGSVIGMVLLFIALLFGWVKPSRVAFAANFLVRNMALFFVPVGTGIMISFKYLDGNYIAVIVSVVLSTIMVLLVTGFIQQKMEQWKK